MVFFFAKLQFLAKHFKGKSDIQVMMLNTQLRKKSQFQGNKDGIQQLEIKL